MFRSGSSPTQPRDHVGPSRLRRLREGAEPARDFLPFKVHGPKPVI